MLRYKHPLTNAISSSPADKTPSCSACFTLNVKEFNAKGKKSWKIS